jgi:hypothetical protein
MQSLLSTALVGTAQAGASTPATGTEADALIAALSEANTERRLLLAAGTAAVYRTAGYVPETISDAPVPAPDDTPPICSPHVAELLLALLAGRKHELIREALDRLGRAGLRLPPDLLPVALDTHEAEVRATLVPVIGERGRWLASFNNAWNWVNDYLPQVEGTLPADAETVWEEGTTGQRVEILRRVRAVDPERGRQWLQAVWKQEKADVRVDLLSALAVELGQDDETLLESALDDRAQSVRAAAAALLAKLPRSALVARMTARADAMLSYTAGKLDARPPKALEPDAVRDGIPAKPAYTSAGSERAWWLMQILCRVPPAHWLDRFGLPAAALVAATADTSWQTTILEGWTHAAATYQDRDWVLPLWNYWGDPPRPRKGVAAARNANDLRAELAALVDTEELERQALAALDEAVSTTSGRLNEVLDTLPMPWSRTIGEAYLRSLRRFADQLTKHSQDGVPFDATLDRAALALPSECLTLAAEPVPAPEDNSSWYFQRFRTRLEEFADVIHMRRRIVEEIPL